MTLEELQQALAHAEKCADGLTERLLRSSVDASEYFTDEYAIALARWLECAGALREEIRRRQQITINVSPVLEVMR